MVKKQIDYFKELHVTESLRLIAKMEESEINKEFKAFNLEVITRRKINNILNPLPLTTYDILHSQSNNHRFKIFFPKMTLRQLPLIEYMQNMPLTEYKNLLKAFEDNYKKQTTTKKDNYTYNI